MRVAMADLPSHPSGTRRVCGKDRALTDAQPGNFRP